MRILVFCPLATHHPRLYARAMTALFEQDWDGPYELLFGVSKDALDVNEDMRDKLERARQMALDGGFDALFVVGHDVQAPGDALRRLAAVQAGIVHGVVVEAEPPYAWNEMGDGGCTLYRREALVDDGWREVRGRRIDLYCTRLSLAYGGTMITPDPTLPERVNIQYHNPAMAPVTVPYSKDILAREAQNGVRQP